MAIATPSLPRFEPLVTPRRVRHPLERLRGYIRFYVVVEGVSLVVVGMALWFWLGLLLDYGVFKAFTIDWVQELGEFAWGRFWRFALLFGLLTGLASLVAFKVVVRLLREFREGALALVLERRFPEPLGDRLITAVELADTDQAASYGYSRPMIERTVADAAARVSRLDIRQVFNWGRLIRLVLLGLGTTLGLYALILWVGATLARSSVADFATQFHEVATIWCERNLLLADTLWPRRAFLELVQFPASGELRVGRDSPRPVLRVRASKWIIADTKAPGGWRPLHWFELKRPDLLGPDVAAALGDLVPPVWFIEIVRRSGLTDERRVDAVLAAQTGRASAQGHVYDHALGLVHAGLLTESQFASLWENWSADQVALQLARDQREDRRTLKPGAAERIEAIFDRVRTLAAQPSQRRRLRELIVPKHVVLDYWGPLLEERPTLDLQEDNEYRYDFAGLKESIHFTVRGEDFVTLPRRITLVPPPTLVKLTRLEERPLYLYERAPVDGSSADLKLKKKRFDDLPPVLVTGETSRIDEIPAGTNLELTAEADQPIESFRLMAAGRGPTGARPVSAALLEGALVQRVDDRIFRIRFDNLSQSLDFFLEFTDRNGVMGRRHVVIEPKKDGPPEVKILVEVVRRGAQGQYLITPIAFVPFSGEIRDDRGLDRLDYAYSFRRVEPTTGTGPRAVALSLSSLRFLAGGGPDLLPLVYIGLAQIERTAISSGEGQAPLASFSRRWKETAPALIHEHLLDRDAAREIKESAPDFEAFDLERHLRGLKATDEKTTQPQYDVQVVIHATDNNADTGPATRPSETFRFRVISENELLVEIGKEEEGLHDKLEKSVGDLKEARQNALEKVLRDLPVLKTGEHSLMALRVKEIADTVLKVEERAGEVLRDYRRIQAESRANRVNQPMRLKVDDICQKLADVLDPVRGEASLARETLEEVAKGLEQMARVDLPRTQLARQRLDALIAGLERILDKMGELTTINKLIAQLVEISKAEQQEYERLKALREKLELELIEKALIPPEKPKK
jgi:hypothetical protein